MTSTLPLSSKPVRLRRDGTSCRRIRCSTRSRRNPLSMPCVSFGASSHASTLLWRISRSATCSTSNGLNARGNAAPCDTSRIRETRSAPSVPDPSFSPPARILERPGRTGAHAGSSTDADPPERRALVGAGFRPPGSGRRTERRCGMTRPMSGQRRAGGAGWSPAVGSDPDPQAAAVVPPVGAAPAARRRTNASPFRWSCHPTPSAPSSGHRARAAAIRAATWRPPRAVRRTSVYNVSS